MLAHCFHATTGCLPRGRLAGMRGRPSAASRRRPCMRAPGPTLGGKPNLHCSVRSPTDPVASGRVAQDPETPALREACAVALLETTHPPQQRSRRGGLDPCISRPTGYHIDSPVVRLCLGVPRMDSRNAWS